MDGVHHRRARPTLRLLREDLKSGWGSVHPQRALAEGRLGELHPLSELPHPIITKAVGSFGANAADDNPVGPIASSTRIQLMEIKQSQWRGGIWEDSENGVCWLVVAGLAKGGHLDHDDFYNRVERADKGGVVEDWLPTDDDRRLLKQETAARLRTVAELKVQQDVLDVLSRIHGGGTARLQMLHPVPGVGLLADVDITVTPIRDHNYEADEIVVEFTPEKRFAGSELLWQMTIRVLISLEPPEQGWDRFGDTYSNIGEPGAWESRVHGLRELVQAGDLAVSEPGSTSHYVHREHLAGKTIAGEAVRALCGSVFVPRQDHDSLPPCPACEERMAEL